MNKELKNIFNVAVGISFVILLISFVALILNHAEVDSTRKLLNENSIAINQQENVLLFIKWTTLALFFLCIPFIIGAVAGGILNSDMMRLFAAVAGLIIIIVSIIFIVYSWDFAVISEKKIDEIAFSALSVNRSNLASLIVSVFIVNTGNILSMKLIQKRMTEVQA